jgi:hypothetical protein
VRPGHKTDGELQLLHWHEPSHIAMGPSPSHDLLDSIEQKERHALEVSYGCRKWQPLVEYHGNWGWSCLAPFVDGQPNWAKLANRVDAFRARRDEKRAIRAPGATLDTLNTPTWWITVWTPAGSDSHFALPMRPVGGILDSAAAEYNAEGGALIDSILALARRH